MAKIDDLHSFELGTEPCGSVIASLTETHFEICANFDAPSTRAGDSGDKVKFDGLRMRNNAANWVDLKSKPAVSCPDCPYPLITERVTMDICHNDCVDLAPNRKLEVVNVRLRENVVTEQKDGRTDRNFKPADNIPATVYWGRATSRLRSTNP